MRLAKRAALLLSPRPAMTPLQKRRKLGSAYRFAYARETLVGPDLRLVLVRAV